jgi:subtilisin family serine protease
VGCSTGNHYTASLTCTEATPEIRVEPSSLTFDCTGTHSGQQANAGGAPAGLQAAALQPDFSPLGKLVDADEIAKALAAGKGRADVIVNLTKPMAVLAATDFNKAQSLATLQKEVNQRQAAMLATLANNEFTPRYRYQNMAAFSGSISQEGLAKLANDPRVASIEPVRPLHAHLAQGVPLMNALTPRSQYNGSGMAIAICDTGIDYNHPMLGGGGFPNGKVLGGYDFGNNDADPIAVGEAHGTCCGQSRVRRRLHRRRGLQRQALRGEDRSRQQRQCHQCCHGGRLGLVRHAQERQPQQPDHGHQHELRRRPCVQHVRFILAGHDHRRRQRTGRRDYRAGFCW